MATQCHWTLLYTNSNSDIWQVKKLIQVAFSEVQKAEKQNALANCVVSEIKQQFTVVC